MLRALPALSRRLKGSHRVCVRWGNCWADKENVLAFMFLITRRGWDPGRRHKAKGEASEKVRRVSVYPSAGVAGGAAGVLEEGGGRAPGTHPSSASSLQCGFEQFWDCFLMCKTRKLD